MAITKNKKYISPYDPRVDPDIVDHHQKLWATDQMNSWYTKNKNQLPPSVNIRDAINKVVDPEFEYEQPYL